MKKRVLAYVLTAAMVMSQLPTGSVYAAETFAEAEVEVSADAEASDGAERDVAETEDGQELTEEAEVTEEAEDSEREQTAETEVSETEEASETEEVSETEALETEAEETETKNAEVLGDGDAEDAEIEYSGEYESITWSIDKNGKLLVDGSGDFAGSEAEYYTRAPWYDCREDIITAEVNVSGMYNAACMFKDCIKGTSINSST